MNTASGDFFADPLPPADVITMGNILHDWGLGRKIIEDIIDDARRTHARGLLMSLTVLIGVGNQFNFTGNDFAGWCREAGFRQVGILSLAGTASAGIADK